MLSISRPNVPSVFSTYSDTEYNAVGPSGIDELTAEILNTYQTTSYIANQTISMRPHPSNNGNTRPLY